MRKDHHIAIRCDSELVQLVREAAGPGGSMSEGVRAAVKEYATRLQEPTAADVGLMVRSLADALGVTDNFCDAIAKHKAAEATVCEQLSEGCA